MKKFILILILVLLPSTLADSLPHEVASVSRIVGESPKDILDKLEPKNITINNKLDVKGESAAKISSLSNTLLITEEDLKIFPENNQNLIFSTKDFSGLYLPGYFEGFQKSTSPMIAPTSDFSSGSFSKHFFCQLTDRKPITTIFRDARNNYYRDPGFYEVLGPTLMSYSLSTGPFTNIESNILEKGCKNYDNRKIKFDTTLKDGKMRFNHDYWGLSKESISFPLKTVIEDITITKKGYAYRIGTKAACRSNTDFGVYPHISFTPEKEVLTLVANPYDCEKGVIYPYMEYELTFFSDNPTFFSYVHIPSSINSGETISGEAQIYSNSLESSKGVFVVKIDDEVSFEKTISSTPSYIDFNIKGPRSVGFHNVEILFLNSEEEILASVSKTIFVREFYADLNIESASESKSFVGTLNLNSENFKEIGAIDLELITSQGEVTCSKSFKNISVDNFLNLQLICSEIDLSAGLYEFNAVIDGVLFSKQFEIIGTPKKSSEPLSDQILNLDLDHSVFLTFDVPKNVVSAKFDLHTTSTPKENTIKFVDSEKIKRDDYFLLKIPNQDSCKNLRIFNHYSTQVPFELISEDDNYCEISFFVFSDGEEEFIYNYFFDESIERIKFDDPDFTIDKNLKISNKGVWFENIGGGFMQYVNGQVLYPQHPGLDFHIQNDKKDVLNHMTGDCDLIFDSKMKKTVRCSNNKNSVFYSFFANDPASVVLNFDFEGNNKGDMVMLSNIEGWGVSKGIAFADISESTISDQTGLITFTGPNNYGLNVLFKAQETNPSTFNSEFSALKLFSSELGQGEVDLNTLKSGLKLRGFHGFNAEKSELAAKRFNSPLKTILDSNDVEIFLKIGDQTKLIKPGSSVDFTSELNNYISSDQDSVTLEFTSSKRISLSLSDLKIEYL